MRSPTVDDVTTAPRPPAARTRRTAGPRVDRRRAIIDAAIALSGEQPYDEVNVADIAKRAGVSHGLLFYYFEDKWAVTTEALRQILDDLRDVQAPRLTESSPRGQVEGFTRRHLQFVLAHRDAYLALLDGGVMSRPEVREMLDRERREGTAVIAAILDLPTPLEPMTDLALLSWAATLDVCAEQVLRRTDLDLESVVTWLVDRLHEDVGRA